MTTIILLTAAIVAGATAETKTQLAVRCMLITACFATAWSFSI